MKVDDMLKWYELILDTKDMTRVLELYDVRNEDNKVEVDAELFSIYNSTLTPKEVI
jgi:hypothetical protein|tara:strand:+ start:19691 stop:19858 length:168 start_codon:yes stop_codon:yes gene_type:complete